MSENVKAQEAKTPLLETMKSNVAEIAAYGGLAVTFVLFLIFSGSKLAYNFSAVLQATSAYSIIALGAVSVFLGLPSIVTSLFLMFFFTGAQLLLMESNGDGTVNLAMKFRPSDRNLYNFILIAAGVYLGGYLADYDTSFTQNYDRVFKSPNFVGTVGNAGEPLAQPPYGYMKSPENKKKWIIDPDAAPIVQEIFQMALEGNGNETIAGVLQERQVLIPMAYWHSKGLPRGGNRSQPNPCKWSKSTVAKVLSQQEYCGDIINFKTYSKSFKQKARLPNAEKNWVIFKGVHEPIIDRDVFEQVQKRMSGLPSSRTSTNLSGWS